MDICLVWVIFACGSDEAGVHLNHQRVCVFCSSATLFPPKLSANYWKLFSNFCYYNHQITLSFSNCAWQIYSVMRLLNHLSICTVVAENIEPQYHNCGWMTTIRYPPGNPLVWSLLSFTNQSQLTHKFGNNSHTIPSMCQFVPLAMQSHSADLHYTQHSLQFTTAAGRQSPPYNSCPSP